MERKIFIFFQFSFNTLNSFSEWRNTKAATEQRRAKKKINIVNNLAAQKNAYFSFCYNEDK